LTVHHIRAAFEQTLLALKIYNTRYVSARKQSRVFSTHGLSFMERLVDYSCSR